MRFTLVHSPLVGPTTWAPVAAWLVDRGHDVAVPSLVAAAEKGNWQRLVDVAANQACQGNGAHAVVGHSGAGPLLPQVARRMSSRPDAHVFVDATVPPESGLAELVPAQFFDFLTKLAHDHRLPKWAEWFGDDVMDTLVVDPALRAAALEEMPRLPLSYFAEGVPVAKGWTRTPSAYLLLSEPYGGELTAAGERGWPVAVEPGQHLDLLNKPDVIGQLLVELSQAALTGRGSPNRT